MGGEAEEETANHLFSEVMKISLNGCNDGCIDLNILNTTEWCILSA